MRIPLLLFTLNLFISQMPAQTVYDETKITYFTPKKIFYVKVIYTVKNTMVFKEDSGNESPLKHYTTVTIEDPIEIEGKTVWGDPFELNYSNLGKRGKSFQLTLNFDEYGNGILTDLNSSQTSITTEIIKGTVGIATSVISTVTNNFIGISGWGGFSEDEKPFVQEQKVEIRQILLLGQKNENSKLEFNFHPNNFSYNIVKNGNNSDEHYPAMNIIGTIPKVIVTCESISTTFSPPPSNVNATLQNGIYYRQPNQHRLIAKVENNLFVREQRVIDEIVAIPQTGTLRFIPITNLKGNRTVVLSFDPRTGGLTKFEVGKTSDLKTSLGAVDDSIEELSKQVKLLQEEIAKNKENKN